MTSSRLGKFIREFELEGVRFLCRGLTVGEFADLAQMNLLRMTDRLFIEVAVCGVVGWEGDIYDVDENGNKYRVEFEPGVTDAEALPHSVCVKLGKFIYHEMTALPKDVAEKFRGFIRYLYWNSEDENRSQAETFDCEVCLEKGLAVSRPCGKFDMEFREEFLTRGEDKPETPVHKQISNRRKKYGNKKLSQKRSAKRKARGGKGPTGRRGYMTLNDFKFPECPISWVDEWIKVFGEVMYHAEKSDLTLFGGGIFDQPYQIHRASKTVKAEFNKIEAEKMEESRKKAKK